MPKIIQAKWSKASTKTNFGVAFFQPRGQIV